MTEKELLKDQPKQLYKISQLINDKVLSLEEIMWYERVKATLKALDL